MNFAPFCSWDSMSPSASCEFLISSRAEIKYHARFDELERVDETAVDLSELFLVVAVIILELAIAGTSIKTRTFGERIVVASGNAVVLGVFIGTFGKLFREVNIIEAGSECTSAKRSSGAKMQAVALQTQRAAEAVVSIIRIRADRTKVSASQFISTSSSLMLEILSFSEDLNDFKVIAAAQEDQLAILVHLAAITIITSGRRSFIDTILRQFVTDSKRGRAIFTRQTD